MIAPCCLLVAHVVVSSFNEPGGEWPLVAILCCALGNACDILPFRFTPDRTRWYPEASLDAVVLEEVHHRDRLCCALQPCRFSFVRTPIPGCRVGVRREERRKSKCQPCSNWSDKAGSQSRKR
jgi:hypothetical protein